MPGRALVTGGAGFIGSHIVDALLADRWHVTVVDNFDPFYPAALKRRNIAPHRDHRAYSLVEADLRDMSALRDRLSGEYDVVVHLAAKAGVRPSLERPLEFSEVNIRGTQHLLELCRRWGVKQFIFASSSSVYGVNANLPWREDDHVLLPISPYASTKVSGELIGHVYSALYGIRFLALRFFTVYGPRQRPDLAIHSFWRAMANDQPISLYGTGVSRRDYTFVADVVDGVLAAMAYRDTSYEVINLGNGRAITLLQLVHELEAVLGKRAVVRFLPEQPGDVPATLASIEKARQLLGYSPETTLRNGLSSFASWMDEMASTSPRSPAGLETA